MAFKAGVSGNPSGRPVGRPDKRTRLREQLTAKGGALLTAMIEKAEGGDVDSLKFLLGRLIPPARDLPVSVPSAAEGDSLASASKAVVTAALSGSITPLEASELGSALSAAARVEQIGELEERLTALERLYEKTNRETGNGTWPGSRQAP
jgi:hypothetical protein